MYICTTLCKWLATYFVWKSHQVDKVTWTIFSVHSRIRFFFSCHENFLFYSIQIHHPYVIWLYLPYLCHWSLMSSIPTTFFKSFFQDGGHITTIFTASWHRPQFWNVCFNNVVSILNRAYVKKTNNINYFITYFSSEKIYFHVFAGIWKTHQVILGSSFQESLNFIRCTIDLMLVLQLMDFGKGFVKVLMPYSVLVH